MVCAWCVSGLKAGERIVVNGLQRVRPGMVIKPRIVPMEDQAAGAPAAPAAGCSRGAAT